MANQDDEIEIQHRTLIEEEEIDISDLPKEIKSAMRNFNTKLKKYEETEDAEIFLELQQDDSAIANNILTYIEDLEAEEDEEEEEGEEEEEEQEPVKNKQQAKKAPVAQAPVAQAPVAPEPVVVPPAPVAQTPVVEPEPVVVPPAPAPELSSEEKVKNAMKDGIISVTDLEKIINQEPDYPYQIVGNLKLKKQYLRPYYESV